MEDIDGLSHPSRNIPDEAYPEDMPRPEANPDDLPLPDEAHPDDMPDENGAGIEMPAHVATPNQVPLSLHSFIRGRRSPGNVGLLLDEGVQFRSNRRLLSPQRPPPPSYLESIRDPEPGLEMMPLHPVSPQDGAMQPGQLLQQQNEPPLYPFEGAPQNDIVPPGEGVGGRRKRRRTKADWKAIGVIGGCILIVGSLIIIMAVAKP